jgi:hypothetical protein
MQLQFNQKHPIFSLCVFCIYIITLLQRNLEKMPPCNQGARITHSV